MKQNSTPFDVAEYDKQIKRTLPFYEKKRKKCLRKQECFVIMRR